MGALFVSWHLLHLCGFTAFTGDYQASYYNNLILANQMYPFLDGIMSLLLCVCVFFSFFFFFPFSCHFPHFVWLQDCEFLSIS